MFEIRFTLILRLLQKTMGNHVVRHDLHGPVLILLWNRLSRTIRLFERLVALWRAGSLPQPRPSRAGQPHPARAAKAVTIPRTFAWLIKLTGIPAATAASQLRHWMTDEELRRFLAECPQAARLIRPICHMVGMRPTEVELAPIRLPARPRKPRAPRPPKPPRLRLTPARGFTRAQIDRMTAADLTAHYGRLPPHFPLPIPNLNYIRRKIAAG
eukprot:gene539-758_t